MPLVDIVRGGIAPSLNHLSKTIVEKSPGLPVGREYPNYE